MASIRRLAAGIAALVVACVLASCVKTLPPVPAAPTDVPKPPTVVAIPSLRVETNFSTSPSPAARPDGPTTPTQSRDLSSATVANGPKLTLTIMEPLDESLVSSGSITVTGQTIAGAVVSVNGEIVSVDANGRFRTVVNLDEGPNIIQVVGSDDSGNEISKIVQLVYEP